MSVTKSENLFREARKLIPGGVNSPVRACNSVGGQPIFIEKGNLSKIYDVDGNEYIDYVLSWGPLILGHRPACVIDALKKVLEMVPVLVHQLNLKQNLPVLLLIWCLPWK